MMESEFMSQLNVMMEISKMEMGAVLNVKLNRAFIAQEVANHHQIPAHQPYL